MTITARPSDPVAFAPYGAFVAPPSGFGERAAFNQWLEPVSGRSQHAHVNRVPCSTLPLTVDRVECHPHAAQLFLPMGEVSRYLVVVMPADAAGDPDSGIAPGTPFEAIPDDWHCPICGSRKASFVPYREAELKTA